MPFSGQYAERRVAFGRAPPTDEMKPDEIWLFEKDNEVVAVNFWCPCGCRATVYTPVDDTTAGRTKTPANWGYQKTEAGITLHPSIRFTGGCRAHFHIRDSRAVMCADTGR